jgi:short-subunit dehydrogenase
MNKVVLITGSSSGIGLATSIFLARKNYLVYASMRNLKRSKELKKIIRDENLPIIILKIDVTKQNTINQAIKKIMKSSGKVDVLINNAGFGLFGCIEDLSINEIKQQYETNVFGQLRMINSVLPIMRRQKSGYIVNISSIGGRVSYPISGVYNSTKFALEGLTEALKIEVKKFGIKVILIEPDIVRTNFAKSLKFGKKVNGESPYKSVYEEYIPYYSSSELIGINPEEVAKTIYRAINSKNPKFRYIVGSDALKIAFLRNIFPDRFIEFLIEHKII